MDRQSGRPASLQREFEKLHQDLCTVQEKVDLYRDLVRETGTNSIDNEDVQDIADFLNQCQPRMNALIDAGMEDRLDEETLEKCLKVNDNLVKVLNGEISSQAPASETTMEKRPSLHELMGDIDINDESSFFYNTLENKPPAAPTSSVTATTQEAASTTSSTTAANASSNPFDFDDGEFDDFVTNRSSSKPNDL